MSPSATRRYMPSAHSGFVPSKMRAFLNRSGVIRRPFLVTNWPERALLFIARSSWLSVSGL